jgi:replicative DNA helicase
MLNDKFYNIQAEVEVLSAILKDNKALYKILACIYEDDFYLDEHKIIYKTMKNLAKNSSIIDVTTVFEAIGVDSKELCTLSYIAEISTSSASSLNI